METIIDTLKRQFRAVMDGATDPILAYKGFKEVADTVKTCMDDMYPAVIDELDKYHTAELAERGIQVRNGSRSWDFSGCGEWVLLKQQIKALEEQLKARASLPQAELVDAETGELLERPTYTVGKRAIVFAKPKK